MSKFLVGDEVSLEGHPQKYLVVADIGRKVVVTSTEPDTVSTQVIAYPAGKVSPYVAPIDQDEASEQNAEGS